MNLARLFFSLAACTLAANTPWNASAETRLIPASDPNIVPSDFVSLNKDLPQGSLGFDRVLDMPAKGYRWDSPGSRVRFRTNSPHVSANLSYTDKHTASARNSKGAYRIDGRSDPSWIFTRPSGSAGNAEIRVTFPTPQDGLFHTYELIFPYGDSVIITGIEVDSAAKLDTPEARPSTRYVAFGDSITHGFTSSCTIYSYAFRVAEKKGWQLIDAGFGGRGAKDSDGDYISSLNPDIVSILIGVNSWQGGMELEGFRTQMTGQLQRLCKARPGLKIYLITPLWVPPTWKPEKAKYPLESYRETLRDIAKSTSPQITVVEGPSLTDEDASLFDKVAVHPNDSGFAQMAERLAEKMSLP